MDPNHIRSKDGGKSTVSDRTKQTIASKIKRGELMHAGDAQKYLWSLAHKLMHSSTTKLPRSLDFQSQHNKTIRKLSGDERLRESENFVLEAKMIQMGLICVEALGNDKGQPNIDFKCEYSISTS